MLMLYFSHSADILLAVPVFLSISGGIELSIETGEARKLPVWFGVSPSPSLRHPINRLLGDGHVCSSDRAGREMLQR